MTEREIVITGIGLTTPVGKNVEECRDCVKEKKTGIVHKPAEGLPEYMQYKGIVPEYVLPDDIPPKQMGQMKFLNRGALLGFCSAYEAISAARESISEIDPGRRALYVASGDFTNAGYEFMYPAIKEGSDDNWSSIDTEKLNKAAMDKVNPFFLLHSLHNNLFSFLSAYIQFMGPSTSLASLSPCGGNALELAHRSIYQNKADIAMAVGYGNWITEVPVYELEGLGIISNCSSGEKSFRPFDRNRNGFIPGEGGAAILLEDSESAKKRGATILGKIKGTENCIEFSSNNKISVPEKVSSRNISSLMKNAGCSVDDLSFIIPHGSGTKKGDRSELRSIMEVLGDKKDSVPICGLKPYTGHMGAASDIAEVIIGIIAAKDKQVPATLNFSAAEKEFSGLKISGSSQTSEKNHFISISYGIGGQSSSVLVEV